MAAPDAAFVAVPAARDGPPEAAAAPPAPAGRRSPARRLRDAGIDEVLATWPLWPALAALPLLAQAIAGTQRPLPWAVAGAAALAGAAGAPLARRLLRLDPRVRHRRRGARRACAALGAAALLLAAALPWLPAGPGAGAAAMPALVLAPLLAWLLAPLGAAAAAPAILPLALAAASGLHGGAAPAGVAVAIATGAIAVLAHRRWRRLRAALDEHGRQLHRTRQALLAARQADRDKSRFLAIASHDLRQPVHALGLFAGTLEHRLEGTEHAPLVRNVTRAVDGLERSFNAMLDISRLDAGTVEPNVQHFPLRDVFRRLHMQYAGQAETAGLNLRFAPGGKSVSSDPQLLERILGNLLQNALRYTRQGGVVVVARSTRAHVHVEVWDTGIGIAPADLPRVFDEFFQVGHHERSRQQGLGMGLAIVKRLALLLGHGLTVASTPGRGTLFRLAIARGGLPEIRDATAAADTQPLPATQPRAVLVIDDEEAIREGLRILLEEWGYLAVTAASADGALRALAAMELPPDLIVSDLHLGDGADGIAAIAAVRARCGYDVPAVVVTGDTTQEELQRVAEAGHAVLTKPLQARRLLEVVRRMG
ncbi:hybrid sensor histidine kinase/response regulator [Pseudorhodoferax sp.]|uniref:ATP-binding response regulator n=1 Tax=Pseudorhodoferax sp. TaxID=1993553 RepID=UPI0039E2E1E4